MTGTRGDLKVLGGIVLALCVAGIATLVWFSDGPTAIRAHHDAVETWEAREPVAYAFDYSHCGGMCANCPIRVTVRNGEVVDAISLEPRCSAVGPEDAPTVEGMFDIEAHERSVWFTDRSSVSFDPVWGFPVHISTTCAPGTSDCGSGWSIADFEVLEQ